MKKLFTGILAAGMFFAITTTTQAYTVESGDTLWGIANEKNVELDEIIEANEDLTLQSIIYPNQHITIPNEETAQVTTETNGIALSTFDLLSRLVNAEAKGESFEGKVAVAKVVMNRVEANEFPDTVQGVITQTNQFEPVRNGAIDEASTQDAREAVRVVANGGGDVNGALFFYSPANVDSPFMDSLTTVKVIGGHEFKIS